jgi:hypothetical protein
MVTRDTHLDRVKKFVPAGDNPVYPVLMVTRAVRDSLERFGERIKADREQVSSKLNEAWTMWLALQLFQQGTTHPKKELIVARLGEKASTQWFHYDGTGSYFDFEGLDERDLEKYLLVSTSGIDLK